MEVRYQGTHIPAGIGPSGSFVALLQVVNISVGRGVPFLTPALVDAVGRAARRDTNVLMREKKFAEPWIQGETVYASTGCIDQDRARSIKGIASSHLLSSW